MPLNSTQSVIWWVIDSVSRDRCSTYGYAERTTPTLSLLSERGGSYRGQSHSDWSLASGASMLTATPPEEHGMTDADSHLPLAIPTVAQFFRVAGYSTVAIVANPWLTRRRGLFRGFDRVYSITEDKSLLRVSNWRDRLRFLGRPFTNAGGLTTDPCRHPTEALIAGVAADYINRAESPVFAYVHTEGAHLRGGDYWAPPAWRRRFSSGYDALLAFADHQLGVAINRVEHDAHWIATSDHGEVPDTSPDHKTHEMGHGSVDVPLVSSIGLDATDPIDHVTAMRSVLEMHHVHPQTEAREHTVSKDVESRLKRLGYY